MYAEWAPRGHALVLVYEYDIYYKSEPRANTTYRVTRDAIPGQIYNGIPDWLYEGRYYIFITEHPLFHHKLVAIVIIMEGHCGP